ncbi:restriction endonuclease [Streptomyces sp. NPDC055506]
MQAAATGPKGRRPGRKRVNGTYRHDHGAEFAVIVTTGGFTTAARASGPRYGIHLVDRDALERSSSSDSGRRRRNFSR